MSEKCILALEWRTCAVRNSRERKQESSPRVGERAICILCFVNVENQASRTRGVKKVGIANGALG
jgi:hypothetical protein